MSVFICSLDHVRGMIKIKFLHGIFSSWFVDSRIIILCFHSFYGLKDTKKRSSSAAVGLCLFCFLGGMLDWEST